MTTNRYVRGYTGSVELVRQFREASERLGVELPNALLHVLLFYTTGEVVRDFLKERYGEAYVPYLYARGLFERGPRWGRFQEPLETWWKEYLDGQIDMATAAEGVLRTIR